MEIYSVVTSVQFYFIYPGKAAKNLSFLKAHTPG